MNEFDVRRFGARGDGATDDTAVLQSAIDAAGRAGGGIVLIPPGSYLVQPQQRTMNPGTVSAQGHALVIDHDNITLQGAGRGATRITMRPYADIAGDLETSWQMVAGKVWRGGAIFITGGASKLEARHDIALCGLTIDGGCRYTGAVTFPADPLTGDGWDITHKGVWLQNDCWFDRVTIEDCELFGFKGEIVYGGGQNIGSVTLRESDLHDTNGDCWSVSGRCTVENNKLHRAAHACIEDRIPVGKRCIYYRNEIYDSAVHQLVSLGSPVTGYDSAGPVVFADNYLHDHSGAQSALYLSRGKNITVRDNLFIDVAQTINTRAIQLDAPTGSAVEVHILRNKIRAHAKGMYGGISVANGASLFGCRVEDNDVAVSPAGLIAGLAIVRPYGTATVPVGNVRYARNLIQGAEVAL